MAEFRGVSAQQILGALVVNPVVQTIVGFGFARDALVLFIKAAMATRDTRSITRGAQLC